MANRKPKEQQPLPTAGGSKRAAEDPTGSTPPPKEARAAPTPVVMPCGEDFKAGNKAMLSYMAQQISAGYPEFVRLTDLKDNGLEWPEERGADGRANPSDCWYYEEWEKIRDRRRGPPMTTKELSGNLVGLLASSQTASTVPHLDLRAPTKTKTAQLKLPVTSQASSVSQSNHPTRP
ncbi:hypothetical protein H0H93_016255, partial [Arthromyces matolae]